VVSFTPRGKGPGTDWIGDRVDPRVGLDAVEKRKILHCWESNPGLPAVTSSGTTPYNSVDVYLYFEVIY
jgi:hypothetical protein